MRYLFPALLLLCGCTLGPFDQVSRFHYAGMDLRMVIAPADKVDRHCKKIAERRLPKGEPYRKDSGEPVGESRIACCADQSKRLLWISRDDMWCLPHELCHLEFADPNVCDEIGIGE